MALLRVTGPSSASAGRRGEADQQQEGYGAHGNEDVPPAEV